MLKTSAPKAITPRRRDTNTVSGAGAEPPSNEYAPFHHESAHITALGEVVELAPPARVPLVPPAWAAVQDRTHLDQTASCTPQCRVSLLAA